MQRLFLLACGLFWVFAGAAFAQSSQATYKPSRFHWIYRSGIAARLNPQGVFLSATVQARLRLYESERRILTDNAVGIGPVALVTPAFGRVGMSAEVQALSILQLSASYEFIGFFGNFEFMQSYPSATRASSDADLRAQAFAKTNYSTYGGILTLAAMFQIKLGPIAIRSVFRACNYQMVLRQGDRVWYDSVLDIMSPKNGWTISDDTDALYMSKFGFAAGVRYTLTHAIFGASNFAPGELQAGGDALYTRNGPTHRIGPFFAYTFFDDDRRKFNAPTLVFIAQWFARHRYRTGQEVSQAIPWLALAFQFKGII